MWQDEFMRNYVLSLNTCCRMENIEASFFYKRDTGQLIAEGHVEEVRLARSKVNSLIKKKCVVL